MRKAVVAAVAVFGLIVAGCGDDDDDGASDTTVVATTSASSGETTTGPTPDGGSISIVAEDFKFSEAPAEVPAGVVRLTFDNQGEVDHEVALAEIGDTPIEQFVDEFAPVITEGGAFPDYVDAVAVPIELEAGSSGEVTFTVSEGEYALFCTLTGAVPEEGASEVTAAAPNADEEGGEEEPEGPPHFEVGMIQPITVTAGDAGQLPEADGTITAIDYTFEADIEAGDKVINFVNDGPEQVHFASVSVFPEGTDVAEAEEAFGTLLELDEDAPPPADAVFPEDVGFSGVFSTGLGAQFELFEGEFESGRTYILVCFIQDRSGGAPHAIANQMYKAFTVE